MSVPAEHQEILAEWDRLQAEPPPKTLRPYGCVTMLAAGALLLALPMLSRLTGWGPPETFRTGAFWVLGLAVLGGLVLTFFASSGAYARASERARASLEWLVAQADGDEADRAERTRHAVAVLYYAVVSDGPTASSTFNVKEAAQRLGGSLRYILDVESVLVQERGLAPVFGRAAPDGH